MSLARPRFRSIVAEVWAIIRAEKVATSLIACLVAAMCGSVVLTAGRSVGSQQAILATIDEAGTRSIVVRAEPPAQVTSLVIATLARVEGIEWAGAFGPAVDVRNAAFTNGQPVASRTFYSAAPSVLGIPVSVVLSGSSAYGTESALLALGLPDIVGSLVSSQGDEVAMVGRSDLPDYLGFMEPIALLPAESAIPGPVAIVVVVTRSPELVGTVADTLRELLAAADQGEVSIATSQQYAALRSLIEGELGRFSTGLVAITATGLALVVAGVMYGLVMLHRKDYGRRRALGATRGLIVGLVVGRTLATAVFGGIVGSLVAVTSLAMTGDPLPDAPFVTAVVIIALSAVTLGAVVPAVIASLRDPLTELRVP